MAPVTALAVVVDRPHASVVGDTFEELGGAWADTFRLWKRTDMSYVLMLAHTAERIRRRAPLVFMAKDDEALRLALVTARAQLHNEYVQWAMFMDEGSAGIGLVRSAILMETEMGGRA